MALIVIVCKIGEKSSIFKQSRLCKWLCKQGLNGLLDLQIVQDQKRAMDMIEHDPNLSTLKVVESPLFDLEIRGVPALKFMGDLVWH